MEEDRKKMMDWLRDLLSRKVGPGLVSEEDNNIFKEFHRILDLAPDNLTCLAGKLAEELDDYKVNRYTPVFVRVGDRLLTIKDVVHDDLDNLFDGEDGNGNAVVIEAQLL